MMEETSFIKNMTAHILEIPDLDEYVVHCFEYISCIIELRMNAAWIENENKFVT